MTKSQQRVLHGSTDCLLLYLPSYGAEWLADVDIAAVTSPAGLDADFGTGVWVALAGKLHDRKKIRNFSLAPRKGSGILSIHGTN